MQGPGVHDESTFIMTQGWIPWFIIGCSSLMNKEIEG